MAGAIWLMAARSRNDRAARDAPKATTRRLLLSTEEGAGSFPEIFAFHQLVAHAMAERTGVDPVVAADLVDVIESRANGERAECGNRLGYIERSFYGICGDLGDQTVTHGFLGFNNAASEA